MRRLFRACVIAGLLLSIPAAAATAQAPVAKTSESVVVSATKVPEDPVEISNAVSVVTGEEIRRRGARTLAEALQDVAGLDTANGSDNGSRLPNIGLWGLKEFDALLITLDGVPVGGPFNPSLSQIPVEDIERIEIVRGPQGTLYGVSAFAGMIQVFTRRGVAGGSLRLGGGSFSERYANASFSAAAGKGLTLRAFGSLTRSNGWQDRTDSSADRFNFSGQKKWGQTSLDFNLSISRDTQHFGSPLPVDAGQPLPGF